MLYWLYKILTIYVEQHKWKKIEKLEKYKIYNYRMKAKWKNYIEYWINNKNKKKIIKREKEN